MTQLTTHGAWVLVFTFTLSLAYELYRATVKAGTSKYDSLRAFFQGLGIYVVAAIVIALLFAEVGWAAWAGLILSVGAIIVSLFYYNPRVMPERKPGLVDWFEDLVFTGLHFVAATLLLYEVLGKSLRG